MTRHPVADHGSKLPDLKMEILRRAVAQKIFIQSAAGAAIARIEPAIEAGLGKEINVRSNLQIKEQGQSRVQKKVVLGKNETGRGLIDRIRLQIGKSAELQMEAVLRIVERKCVVNFLEKIGARGEAKSQGN